VDVSPESPIMQEEVFGPILPVLEIGSVKAVIEWVNSRPRPLGLYVFAEDLSVAERIIDATESGDAVITTARSIRLSLNFRSEGSATRGWASTTGSGVFRRSPMRAASCITAP
jgi:acyl-CoA reductase-like NAD-dependent aldehyde dehydrogenase